MDEEGLGYKIIDYQYYYYMYDYYHEALNITKPLGVARLKFALRKKLSGYQRCASSLGFRRKPLHYHGSSMQPWLSTGSGHCSLGSKSMGVFQNSPTRIGFAT